MKSSQEAKEFKSENPVAGDANRADANSGPIAVEEDLRQKRADSQTAFVLPDRTKLAQGSRRGGGPRTVQGKNRSKQNALSHGIFARATVLANEPRKEFNSLLQGFRDSLQPEGSLEELLVEKLASLTWRYRRLLLTEKAEIRLGGMWNPIIEEDKRREREEALELFRSIEQAGPGLLHRYQNPLICQRIIWLLRHLSLSIRLRDFDFDFDTRVLKVVYGEGVMSTWVPLYVECNKYSNSKTDQARKEELKANFLKFLQDDIEFLQDSSKGSVLEAIRRKWMLTDCRSIPESQRLDRILRYEASLERSFDRTLSQLERIQKTRRGEFVLPEQRLRMTIDSK